MTIDRQDIRCRDRGHRTRFIPFLLTGISTHSSLSARIRNERDELLLPTAAERLIQLHKCDELISLCLRQAKFG